MIFHVITNFSELGGAEFALIRLVNNSPSGKVKIISLMSYDESMQKKITNEECDIVALGATGVLSLLLSSLKLMSLIRKFRPARVYSWMYHANAITAISKMLSTTQHNLIWGVRHSLDDYEGEKFSTKIAIKLGRVLRSSPSKVVYCSQKARVQHENIGYNSISKSVFIPNGYEFGEFNRRSFSDRHFVLGAAGRFHPAKDYAMLIDMALSLKGQGLRFELRICGRGITEKNEALMALISGAGLIDSEIKLLGELSDMNAFYQSLDIFVLTSKTEGFPNVLAEAAAMGCAVFTTDVGDASLIVNNDEHIVSVGASRDMAEKIFVFANKPQSEKMHITSHSSSHVRNQFSIKQTVKRYLEL